MLRVVFCFDVVCPYAYMASTQIEAIAAKTGAELEWRPVLLGGLYALTKAPQGPSGSATDAMPAAKKAHAGRDLFRQAARFGVPLKYPPKNPRKSLSAMRLLCIAPASLRPALAKALFRAFWVEEKDLEDRLLLSSLAAQYGLSVEKAETEGKEVLQRNTQAAFESGAFGVPTYFVTDASGKQQMFFGADRLHLVARALGDKEADMPRLIPRSAPAPAPPAAERKKLRFFFDFSSPWAFLGWTQVRKQLMPIANVELVPIFLGALFKMVGTPIVPAFAVSEQKRAYGMKDLQDWARWWGESLRFPSFFPFRTTNPLRIAIIDNRTVDCMFRAAWQQHRNIGDDTILKQVLTENGFDAEALFKAAQSQEVKDRLVANTNEAKELGVFGVPTYYLVEDKELIWGQDRINVVIDMLLGWKPPQSLDTTPLSAAAPITSKL